MLGQIPISDLPVGRLARIEWLSRAFGLHYIVTVSVSASAVALMAWIHGTWGASARCSGCWALLLILLDVMLLPKGDQALRRKDALEHEKERGGENTASR